MRKAEIHLLALLVDVPRAPRCAALVVRQGDQLLVGHLCVAVAAAARGDAGEAEVGVVGQAVGDAGGRHVGRVVDVDAYVAKKMLYRARPPGCVNAAGKARQKW